MAANQRISASSAERLAHVRSEYARFVARPASLICSVFAISALLLLLFTAASSNGAQAGKRCSGKVATIVGTTGSDTGSDRLVGTPGDDVIVGRGGRDEIDGRSGKDLICGGSGADAAGGGGGDDKVKGQAGNDLLLGGGAADTLIGGTGADAMNGQGGRDVCAGGSGDDLASRQGCEKITGATEV
jgi:hypothetical protein